MTIFLKVGASVMFVWLVLYIGVVDFRHFYNRHRIHQLCIQTYSLDSLLQELFVICNNDSLIATDRPL